VLGSGPQAGEAILKRRDFIRLVGGAATWPVAAQAQQSGVSFIGFLAPNRTVIAQARSPAFLQTLGENDFVEGRTVGFIDRDADARFERLPALAADLVRARVAVMFAGGPPAVRAAMAATLTIPIVFAIGEDPVKEGLVASLNRPGGNVTGYTTFTNQLGPKRLELLREIAPKAVAFALLVNPNNPNADPDTADARAATEALGLRLEVLSARTEPELEAAFATVAQKQLGGLLVGADPWFRERPERVAALAAQYAVPVMYDRVSFPAAGGLISYSASEADRDRQTATLIARILKGAKPADLPVMRATKFELTINIKAARAIGLTLPDKLIALADGVIE
jgi:putative tryptophan/tyrosine transport system substrate-binding protein